MPFCLYCGTKLNDADAFCFACGKPTAQPTAPAAAAPGYGAFPCDFVQGQEQSFPFFGSSIVVPASIDAFNYYRKQFSAIARSKANDLRTEYCYRVVDLDTFLTVFPEIYRKHRKAVIDTAMEVFSKAEIYDISPEQFEDQHTADFCLCGEDVDVIIDSFNQTIEANQDRKISMYNMMPGMVFRGLGGFAAALAVNVAVNKIAEHDIKNANVTPAQRAELFARINFEVLMERAYIDYWRVFLSLTYMLNQKGYGVWYPNETGNNRASGLYQNLISGRIPPDKVVSQTTLLFSLNPYADEYLQYLTARFGVTPETQAIVNYFSVS